MERLDQEIIEIVNEYFDENTPILIFGSQAKSHKIDLKKDLDILIVKDVGYYRGVQNQKIHTYDVDITMIPLNNFELLMLKEIHKDRISPMIHALHNGRIIRDKLGQLTFYKDFATFIFKNKKNIYSCTSERFSYLIQVSKKYISDYQIRANNSLESFILLSQVLDSIMNIELFFNLGWSLDGKTKVKLIRYVNPDLHRELEELVQPDNRIDEVKINLSILDKHLLKYQEIIDNSRLPSLHNSYFWYDKIALRIYDKNKIKELCKLFEPYIIKEQCHIYYVNAPLKPYSDSYYQFVILGDRFFLLEVLIPLIIKLKMESFLLNSSHFPLLEIFNGGHDILPISEKFYSWLCETLLDLNPKHPDRKINELDPNHLMVIILSLYADMSVDPGKLDLFYQYLFDSWFSYSYYNTKLEIDELDQAIEGNLESFKIQYNNNKENISSTINYLKEEILEDDPIFVLRTKLIELIAKTKSCKVYVPEFEKNILKLYASHDSVLGLWYVHKRHLECIFSIFNIEENNWAYLLFMVKEYAKT